MKWLIVILSTAAVGVCAYAQEAQVLKVNVELVQVHATVTNVEGQFIRNLKPDYFEVLEDGVPQHVESFASDDAPLTIGIILDVGGTMKANLPLAKEAGMAFLNVGRLDNEYFLVEFNNKAEVTQDLTRDFTKLRDHVAVLKGARDKAPYDGMYLGLDKLRDSTRSRKVLLVLTTGGYIQNEHSAAQVRNLARQLDAQLFGVDLPTEIDIHGEASGKDDASNVIEPVGGLNFVATSGSDYLNICRRIAVSVRNEYDIAYRSTNSAHDGKYRRVQVKLHLPKGAPELFVQARDGYYAPGY